MEWSGAGRRVLENKWSVKQAFGRQGGAKHSGGSDSEMTKCFNVNEMP
jgi:hypothetical protein